jgi:hypothetical protein
MILNYILLRAIWSAAQNNREKIMWACPLDPLVFYEFKNGLLIKWVVSKMTLAIGGLGPISVGN